MAVQKSIDLTATGPTIEDAVNEAVHRASLTLKGLTTFEIERIDGTVEDNEVQYRVLVRVSFVVKEQIHE
jgi:dodecin